MEMQAGYVKNQSHFSRYTNKRALGIESVENAVRMLLKSNSFLYKRKVCGSSLQRFVDLVFNQNYLGRTTLIT